MRAVGAFTIDMTWENGKATTVRVTSHAGRPAIIKHTDASCCFDVTDESGNVVSFEILGDDEIRFETEAGKTYTLTNNGQTNILQCDNIEEGDYYISFPNDGTPLYLRQISARSGNIGLSENKEEKGTIWTITPYPATSPLNAYNNSDLIVTTGNIYYLNNREYNYGLRNLFIRTTIVNAQSLHPIYKHQINGLYAIRATNIDSEQSNYSSWYGIDNGSVSAKVENISCYWQLELAPTDGISTHHATYSTADNQYYSISGARAGNILKKGVYIQQQQRADGSMLRKKRVIK